LFICAANEEKCERPACHAVGLFYVLASWLSSSMRGIA
jgi:hypothetical protein